MCGWRSNHTYPESITMRYNWCMSRIVTEVLDLASEQGGLLTTQQAQRRGISRLALSRLADQNVIERLAHGVYATAEGATGQHSALRAAWLSLDPQRFAFERIEEDPAGFAVTHRSAAELWGIGQLIPDKLEFVSTTRKRTRREDVRLRRRAITGDDITVVEGLPCTTIERTTADLIDSHEDLSLVTDAFGDIEFGKVNFDRLRALLDPLAHRNSFADGSDFVRFLMSGSNEFERGAIASLLSGPLKPLMDSLRPQLPHLVLDSPSSPAFQRAMADIAKKVTPDLKIGNVEALHNSAWSALGMSAASRPHKSDGRMKPNEGIADD